MSVDRLENPPPDAHTGNGWQPPRMKAYTGKVTSIHGYVLPNVPFAFAFKLWRFLIKVLYLGSVSRFCIRTKNRTSVVESYLLYPFVSICIQHICFKQRSNLPICCRALELLFKPLLLCSPNILSSGRFLIHDRYSYRV